MGGSDAVRRVRRFFYLPVLALLLSTPSAPGAVEGTGPGPGAGSAPPQPIAKEPLVSNELRESADGYVMEDARRRIEFTGEGWSIQYLPGDALAGYRLKEIRGSRGPVLWTRQKKTLDFEIQEEAVCYGRTVGLSEEYTADRDGFRQIWRFHNNPLWEGGDLLIVAKIVTQLDVAVVDGRVQLSQGTSWVGPFCSFEARDDQGNVLDLAPVLSGKTVRLTVPGSWLARVGKQEASRP